MVHHLLRSGFVPGRPFNSRALHAFGEGLEAVTLWFFADVSSMGTMAPWMSAALTLIRGSISSIGLYSNYQES